VLYDTSIPSFRDSIKSMANDITDNEVALINKKSPRINNEINRKRMIKS
jgi:hypothetical protein